MNAITELQELRAVCSQISSLIIRESAAYQAADSDEDPLEGTRKDLRAILQRIAELEAAES